MGNNLKADYNNSLPIEEITELVLELLEQFEISSVTFELILFCI